MAIKSITAGEIALSRILGNLPDKPTQPSLYGGHVMTADEIKAAYDKLPLLVAERFNELVASIESAPDEDSLAAKLLTGIKSGHTLKKLFQDMTDGNLAEYLALDQTATLADFYKAFLSQKDPPNLISLKDCAFGYVSATGTIVNGGASTVEMVSDYIPVTGGDTYTVQSWIPEGSGNSPWIGIGCYKEDKSFYTRLTQTASTETVNGEIRTEYTFTLNESVAYLRISARTYRSGRFMLTKGRDILSYRPNVADYLWYQDATVASLIPSTFDGRYPTLSSADKTFTLPTDTVLIDSRLPNGWVQFNSGIGNNTVTWNYATSAILIYYDIQNDKLVARQYSEGIPLVNYILIAVIRINGDDSYVTCSLPVSVNGVIGRYNTKTSSPLSPEQEIRLKNDTIKSINHRGYNAVAPENTLAAYRLSKAKGFSYVECDVHWTSDGIPVLLHDDTVDRTSNGSGSIANMTLASVKALDFGSWKSNAYAGEKIPTFEEFILLCRNIGLHPYIEIKNGYTQARVAELVAIVKKYGMKGKVTWLGGQAALGYVKSIDAKARLGYVTNGWYGDSLSILLGLKTDSNEVFLDMYYTGLTNDAVNLCIDSDIPVEVWTMNGAFDAINPYVSGFTSDDTVAGTDFCTTELIGLL